MSQVVKADIDQEVFLWRNLRHPAIRQVFQPHTLQTLHKGLLECVGSGGEDSPAQRARQILQQLKPSVKAGRFSAVRSSSQAVARFYDPGSHASSAARISRLGASLSQSPIGQPAVSMDYVKHRRRSRQHGVHAAPCIGSSRRERSSL